MPAPCSSHPKYFLRPSPADAFRRKEARKVAPDNLFGGVPFDSFRASIPTDNLAQRVQHKNRVVLDPVKQHAILFFAVPERSLCPPTRGVVALGAPTNCGGDQQAQSGPEKQ